MKVRVKLFVQLVMPKRVHRSNDKCVWFALDGKIYVAPDNTPRVTCKCSLQDLYKDLQKGAPEIALKGAPQVALELHLFMQLSTNKCVQYDSVKGEIEVALYTTHESASKISF